MRGYGTTKLSPSNISFREKRWMIRNGFRYGEYDFNNDRINYYIQIALHERKMANKRFWLGVGSFGIGSLGYSLLNALLTEESSGSDMSSSNDMSSGSDIFYYGIAISLAEIIYFTSSVVKASRAKRRLRIASRLSY